MREGRQSSPTAGTESAGAQACHGENGKASQEGHETPGRDLGMGGRGRALSRGMRRSVNIDAGAVPRLSGYY